MSKRSLEDEEAEQTVPAKKLRYGDKLNTMKANIDNLLKQAVDEHEQARITAIDKAAMSEEVWFAACSKTKRDELELKSLTGEYEMACTYISEFEKSTTVKMLNKASGCELDSIQSLSKKHDVLKSTLVQLETMKTDLELEKNTAHMQASCSKTEDEKMFRQFQKAEADVEIITELLELKD